MVQSGVLGPSEVKNNVDLHIDPTDSDSSKSSPPTKVTPLISTLPLAAPEEPRSWWQRRPKQDGDAVATRRSVFDDPDMAKRYQPRSDWENLHRFDPSERWTFNEERKVIRKIDKRIMIFTCVMFMALELDRSNLSQAVSDNFLPDLKMDTNDYNLGNTVFKLSFLCAELPSQLVSKFLGPDRWIPMQLCLWSLVSAGQFWLDGRASFLACRALLAIFQGGFIPDTILYLSYFYTASELTVRLAFFWTAYNVADIISGFLGAGFLQLRGWHGYEGWRWLFLFEGLLTLAVGISAWFLMPAGPTQTSGILRGKNGWFTEREERIMVNRVIRDDPSKGDMHNRQPITPKLLWASLKDYDLWPIYAIGLTFLIPATPPAQYFTLTLRGLGFNVLVTNLLTIPHTILSIGGLLLISYLAEKWHERSLLGLAVQIWKLPFMIYLYVVDMSTVNRWVSFAVLTLLLGSPTAHPIQVSWNSRNSNTVRLRTVSAAVYNMSVQSAGIIASNVYRKDDAPRYREGNKNLLAIIALNITFLPPVMPPQRRSWVGCARYLNKKNFIYVSPSTPRPGPSKVTSPPPDQNVDEAEWIPTSSSEDSESLQLVVSQRQMSMPPLTPSVEFFGHLSPLHRSGLQYFTERTVKVLAPHPQIFDELCELILPMAVFNEPLLQGIVALAATHRLATCKTSEERSSQALIVAGFQALSSRSLCQKLSECDEDQQLIPLLAASRALFVCEVFASEPSPDRWSVHFRGARGLISRIQDKGLSQNPTDELRFLLRWFDMTESLVCHSMSDLAPQQSAIPSPTTLASETDDEPVYIDMYLARTKDLLGVFKEIARLYRINNDGTASETSSSQGGQDDAEVWWLLNYLQSIIDRDQATPPPVMSIRGRVLSVAEVQEYRLSNQIWQLTGLLLIHRRLRHERRSSPLVQNLVNQILGCAERMTLRDGLTPVTLLTPPLFFAGCDALGDDRPRIKTSLQGVSTALGLLNTQRALEILEQYWEADPGIDDDLADRSWPKISQFLPY
ncbi:major facilitator superfamily domain-containing protein [Fusarium redolens]|uniref:Major facilitator superfamily domain-containing protein n=1 Tax=Fusarium redolens TaxID=48865 RepID=A0A9P9GDX7_FUSRE|nr:major facilitator superfamily domain-containing protein [Fusarium redolens]KAH7236993.1 major facilitator superfamily domain-containing protein [Fusarium redolens]